MCGLHGVIVANLVNAKYEAFLADAFVTNQVRGIDSSGIATVTKDGVSLYKNTVGGSAFVQEKRTKDVLKEANTSHAITMCHVRAATIGKVTHDNAHPFWTELDGREIVGCHNGTLTVDREENNPYGTDSEWAIGEILESGKQAFTKFKGAFAFTWWDSADPDTLNIACNHQRDVHVVFLKNGGMLYASEAGMLYWLAERNNLSMEGPVRKLAPMQWYKFPVKNPSGFTKEDIPDAVYAPQVLRTTYTATSHTHFDKLATVFGVEEPGNNKPDPLVTTDERKLAVAMGVIGREGSFIPMSVDEKRNCVEGLVTFKDNTGVEHDCEAVIRGYGKITLPLTAEWNVRVIGLKNYGTTDELVICSKPTVVLASEKKEDNLPVPLTAAIN